MEPSHIMWGPRYPSFLNVGEATGRIVYTDYHCTNLSLRTDFRLGQSMWLSASYLNILLHSPKGIISFSPEEWFFLAARLLSVTHIAKTGRSLAGLRNWQDHTVHVGEIVFAPCKQSGSVWVAKRGHQLLITKVELSNLKLHYHRVRELVVMHSKYSLFLHRFYTNEYICTMIQPYPQY